MPHKLGPRLAPALLLSLVALLGAAAFATSAHGQVGRLDTDEHRTDPVPHRYVHGTLGDADFQIALPDAWNGKLLIGARGFSGDEFSSGAFKTIGLQKGYAYALSDQGWNRYTIIDSPEDKYYESKPRILQLTKHTKALVRSHYGVPAARTYMVGGSNGGHNAKWMVEEYPHEYDGALAGYGITSHLEWMASNARFLRSYDVIAPRLDDIVAARTADPHWDPTTTPLDPPLTAAQVQALLGIYEMPGVMADGTTFNIGRPPGSEYRWADSYDSLRGYLEDSLAKMDPRYDPDGDGELSLDEIKAWDPHTRPDHLYRDIRRKDLTGDLQRPVILAHGTHDIIVSPGESEVYQQLVEQQRGQAGARDVLALYWIPGMGHGGPEFDALISPALDALDAWVDHRLSGGRRGAPPPAVLGGYARDL